MLWSLGPWGRPCSAIYPISACIIPPCACVKFAVYSMALFFLRVAVLGISFSPTLTSGFISIYLFYLFIHSFIYLCFPPLSHLSLVWWVLRGGLEQDWVGQSGVPVPWGVIVAPGLLGHLASIKVWTWYWVIYVFIWNIYTGWLNGSAPGPLRYLASIREWTWYWVIYVFIWNIYTGWLNGSAPGPLRYLASIREWTWYWVIYLFMYLFGIFIQAGSVRL